MKKITFKNVFSMVVFTASLVGFSQQRQVVNTNEKSDFSEVLSRSERSESGMLRCVTSEMSEVKRRQGIGLSKDQYENWLAPKIEEVKRMRQQGRMGVITIPVVVHVIHNGDALGSNENITDAQVLSQIQVFNEDFRKLTGTPGDGAGVDTMIEFCMAQIDPTGNSTNGIDRVNLGVAGFDSAAVEGNMKPNTIWDPTKYLNMWTCNFTGDLNGVLGYAQFPTGSGLDGMPADDCIAGEASTDGVIAAYNTFGSRTIYPAGNYSGTSYDKGRTMTHEVGHMLGLRHLWGDGDCSVDDFCADTPNCDGAYFGTGPAPTQCGNTRQIENYMDYSDDVAMNIFTQDQADRMMAVLLNSPRRDDLLKSNVCNPTVEPYVQFKSQDCIMRLPSLVNEGSDCNYTEFTIPLSIDEAASADAIATFSVDVSSTAAANDIEIVTPTVTFPSGSIVDQNLVVRIQNDGFVEGDEQLVISFTLNNNGGDALLNTEGNMVSINIIDNDIATTPFANLTLFSDDFSDGDSNGWTILDNNAETADDWNIVEEANWDPAFGIYTDYFMTSYSWNGSAYNPDNFLSTPQISIPVGATNVQLSYFIGSGSDDAYYNENYEVWVSNSIGSAGNITGGTRVRDENLNAFLTAAGGQTQTIDLTAFAGQDVYVSFRHHDTFNEWLIGVDDVALTADLTTLVQTAVDTGNGGEIVLNGVGTVYTKDASTGNAILDVQNNDAFNYGCITTEVNRAGTSAQAYGGTTLPNYVTDKVFRIGAANTTNTGSTTISFYFTEAELNGWETAVSDSRNNLYVNRDVSGNTVETVATSITAFGTNQYRLTATFTGVDGDFYFGTQVTLPVNDNQFDMFGVYPNPSNGEVAISLSTNKDVNVSLFDIRGRKVYGNLHSNTSDSFNEKVDFSSMASGVYMLEVQSGSKKAIKKLVIQ